METDVPRRLGTGSYDVERGGDHGIWPIMLASSCCPMCHVAREELSLSKTQEHCVKISSNSDENCRRRSILKKNHDVTIMTSSGHVTSSWSCPIDRLWPLSYRLSIGTLPLSGFVSEIFSAKVATTIITWWRNQWRHKVRINYPWGTYRHTIHRNIVLKYRPIPTRIAGEEAF